MIFSGAGKSNFPELRWAYSLELDEFEIKRTHRRNLAAF